MRFYSVCKPVQAYVADTTINILNKLTIVLITVQEAAIGVILPTVLAMPRLKLIVLKTRTKTRTVVLEKSSDMICT
jgi:hypothetical protein